MEFKYFGIVQDLLATVAEKEHDHMEQCVDALFLTACGASIPSGCLARAMRES